MSRIRRTRRKRNSRNNVRHRRTMKGGEPFVICDKTIHPSGSYGCFRCIDEDALRIAENKVKIYAYGDGDVKSDEISAQDFFKFLNENDICFKVFFSFDNFIQEYHNIQILKNMSIEGGLTYLQQYTTYYEYGQGGDVAFVLEFDDGVSILAEDLPLDKYPFYKRPAPITSERIYIVLNRLCNDHTKMSREQHRSAKCQYEIFEALMVLASHGYCHGDTYLFNIADCGEHSNPQYKLIDFGKMRKSKSGTCYNDYMLFLRQIGKGHLMVDNVIDEMIAGYHGTNVAAFAASATVFKNRKLDAMQMDSRHQPKGGQTRRKLKKNKNRRSKNKSKSKLKCI